MPKSQEEKAEIRRRAEALRQPGKARDSHEASRGVRRSKNKSLSHLSRGEIDDDEFSAAIAEMSKGTDRAAAVVGGAFVEDGLRAVLSALLREQYDEKTVFEDSGAPFGTFKQKIVAVRAFGHCTKEMAEDIDAIRDIRNQFSHAIRPLTFDHPDIAARCISFRSYPFDLEDPKLFWAKWSPRTRFQTACQQIWIALMRRSSELLNQRSAELDAQLRDLSKAK